MNEEDAINVRVEFRGEMKKKFEEVKKFLGMENSTDVLRFLVNAKHNEISKEV